MSVRAEASSEASCGHDRTHTGNSTCLGCTPTTEVAAANAGTSLRLPLLGKS